MSKIIQLQDNNENVYPTTQFGELLWTNPNPSSAFASQDVNIDFRNYNFALVLLKETSVSNVCSFGIAVKGGTPIVVSSNVVSGSTKYHIYRYFSMYDNHMQFFPAYKVSGNTESADNSLAIPYKIYGIR